MSNLPPKSTLDIKSPGALEAAAAHLEGVLWYVREYERGWAAAGAAAASLSYQDYEGYAFDDGYLDRSLGRPKWHLTYCPDHDNCGWVNHARQL